MLLLASDIGSTTTKLVAFRKNGSKLELLGSVQEPTTVEPPEADVCKGLFRAAEKLSKEIGEPLISGGEVTLPYFTTSSAGGGLQIMVIGYTLADSCSIAGVAACTAGAVVSGAFAIDSEGSRLELIDRMSRPNPDLVIMAGGTEGGAISGVVAMAHMLNHSKPVSKYGGGRLPLLFCGNSMAREFVRDALDPYFSMSFTDNVIAGVRDLNLMPAVGEVQRIFMEHVMKKAPGYSRVTGMVSAPVKPTPVGVSDILSTFSSMMNADPVLVDMGGATTDIFSGFTGEMRRTVAANIGMSFSMSSTLKEAGIRSIMAHIPGGGGGEGQGVDLWQEPVSRGCAPVCRGRSGGGGGCGRRSANSLEEAP